MLRSLDLVGRADDLQTVNRWIDERSEAHKQGIDRAEDGRKTILDLLLQPEEGEKPLSKASVVDETYSFCFAGTHTTSFTMSLSTYYLLSNPDKLEKLRQEIQTVQPNDEGLLEFAALRTLPYLTAVIKESLRMSSPVPGVIPRCVPEGGMTWAGHFLPAGVSQRSCPKRMSTSSDSGIDFRFHLHPDGAR